jgi:CDP-diacylglycerol--serine O-phosphatidyltransferase
MTRPPRTKPADVMTMGNGVCGFLALAVLAGLAGPARGPGPGLDHDVLVTCLFLYGLGMVFDVLDGPVARWRGSSGLGATLDTICDTISFGLLPGALFVASVHEHRAWRVWALAAAALYVAMTMLRLARYAKHEAEAVAEAAAHGTSAQRGAFSGMPSPVGGNCILAIVVLSPSAPVAVGGAVLVALLLVSDFSYPNNSRYGAIYVGALLVASFAALLGLISLDIPSVAALAGLLPLALVRAGASWTRSGRRLVTARRSPTPGLDVHAPR